MKKNYNLINRFFSFIILLVMLAILPINSIVGQSTVFVDDFGSSHTSLTSGGIPTMTYVATNTSNTGSPIIESVTATGTVPYLKLVTYLSSGPTAGESFITGSLSTFLNQFKSTLNTNTGVVTWSFNIRENQGTMSGLLATQRYIGVVLAASEANLLSPTCTGYMVSQGATTTSGLQLVKFSAGLGVAATPTTIITAPTVTSSKDWFSVKVTYDPSTNSWTLYQRTDALSATIGWVDPMTGTYSSTSSPVVDADYVGTSMSSFGFFGNHPASTTAFNCQFDNFRVQVNVPVTYTATWPKAENPTPTGFTAKVNANVAGTSYYVVLANGAAAPTSAQVKAGKNASDATAISSGSIACAAGSTEYSAAVTGLSNSTSYDVYFVAQDASGSNLQSTPVKVTVSTSASATAPLIQDPTSANILNNSADLGGNITSDGGSAITERGTVWNTTAGVTIANNKLADGLTATGIFTQNRTGLPSKTQIFYKGYVTNSVGTSLTTTEGNFYTLADEPTDQVTNFAAIPTPNYTGSSIDLSWTPATTASGYLILYKKGSTTAPTGRPTDANKYSVGSGIGNGIVAADITSGTTASISVGGLSTSSTYAYVVIAYNSDGVNAGTYNYFLTSPPTASATTDLNTGFVNQNNCSKAFTSNGKLIIFGGDVYNSVGMKVASVKSSTEKTELSLRSGVYIIRTLNGNQKVVLQ